MQLEDREHLSLGNGTFTGTDRALHVNWLCLHQKKASPVHKWLEFDSTGRADEITSPGLACQTDPAQLVQFCSLKTCSVSVVQQFISVGCFPRYGHDPNSGKTCFVVVEGFSWTRLNNIYWTKVCSCWSCSGLTWAWLRSFIFSFICYNAENHCLFTFLFLQPSNQKLRTGFLDPLILQTEKSDNSSNHRKLKNSTCSSTATHCCSWNLG